MDLHELKNTIEGAVVLPGDGEYAEAATTYAGTGEPAVVVRPGGAADVAAAVGYAVANELVLSVKSGGHGGPGFGTNTGGVVIDMSALNSVEVLDAGARTVRIGSGATWGEVAEELREPGLAITSGDTTSVGVGGLTQCGGLGWMVRKYGLAIDNLIGAEIVTADGQVRRASAEENADLFWAIRGGAGNVGVVTTFDFAAAPVRDVVAGTIQYQRDDLQALLRGWRDAMRAAPEELTSAFLVLPAFGPEVPAGAAAFVCYAGDDEQAGMAAIEPLLQIGTVKEHDVARKPYADILEEAHPPPGLKAVAKNTYLPEVSDEVVTAIDTQFGETGAGVAFLRSLGGAMNGVAADATAFAHRDSEALIVAGMFMPGDTSDADAEVIVEKAWGPLAALGRGAYPGFTSTNTERDVADIFPEPTRTRLAGIKQQYDPANLFDQNHNVKPAG
jgi:FAD/FMN-containing dehydrogenase